MAAAAGRAVDSARQGAEGLALFASEPRGDHAAAIDIGFDHDDGLDEPRDDAVTLGKTLPIRWAAQGEFGQHAAPLSHALAEFKGLRWVGEVKAMP